jgi:hypothetical protein
MLTLGRTDVRSLCELTTGEAQLRGELTRAIRKGDTVKIHGLLARGAPLEAAFDLGYGESGNCIDWACVNAQPALALSLLSKADQRGLGDALAQTAKAAFFWSIVEGYSEVLEELLRRGADVSMKSPVKSLDIWSTPGKQTALATAVAGARKVEVAILLKYGAWSYETDAQRAQLFEWAVCRKPVAEAFQEAGMYSAPSPLESPCEKGWLPRLESATPTTRAPTAMTNESGSRAQSRAGIV